MTLDIPRPRGGFRCILADPPWSFSDRGTRLAPSYSGEQRKGAAPYEVMDFGDVSRMGGEVRAIAAKDAFLFLWTPGAILAEGTATAIARRWGFEPKQILPWIKTTKDGKPRIGGGHYTRLTAEYLLLCRRGRATVRTHAEPDVIFAPRSAHSAKPDESYRKIERLCVGPRLELFARRRIEGWDCWGNEAPAPIKAAGSAA